MRFNGNSAISSCLAVLAGLWMVDVAFAQTAVERAKQLEKTFEGPVEVVSNGAGTLVIDGHLGEEAWEKASEVLLQQADPASLKPTLATRVKLIRHWDWLVIGMDCEEPGARISARTVGPERNFWAEDHVEATLQWNDAAGKEKWMQWAVNALGAVSKKAGDKIFARSTSGDNGWSCEMAVPLSSLGIVEGQKVLELRANFGRTRQPRAYQRLEEWAWVAQPGGKISNGDGLLVLAAPPPEAQKTKRDRILLIAPAARSDAGIWVPYHKPALDPKPKADPIYWNQAARFFLERQNGDPRPPEHQTQVLVKQDLQFLQILCVCYEDGPVAAKKAVRDGGLWSDDLIELAIGIPGRNYAHLVVNPEGALWDALGTQKRANWNGPFEVVSKIDPEKKRWMVGISFPLKELAEELNEGAFTHIWQLQVYRVRPANGQKTKADEAAFRENQRVETTIWPVTLTEEFHAPGRFGTMVLDLGPEKLPPPAQPSLPLVHRADLYKFRNSTPRGPVPVRAYKDVTDVFGVEESQKKGWAYTLRKVSENRLTKLAQEWSARWEQLQTSKGTKDSTLHAIHDYLSEAKANMQATLGPWPRKRCSLKPRWGAPVKIEDIEVLPVLFESRPNFPVTANLYVPSQTKENFPALVALPAHHYTAFQRPKGHPDHVALGVNLARAGCAVLVLDHLGMDERGQHHAWMRQAKGRHAMGMQLGLIGESLAAWIAYDASRAADLLLTLKGVDPKRLGVIGAVAGGGDNAALAAALDDRFHVSIPFNFGGAWVSAADYEPTRILRGHAKGGYLSWAILAMRAPKPFIMAREFLFDPGTSVSWKRLSFLYGLLGAENNIAYLNGTKNSHAGNYGALHRKPIYEKLRQWWGIDEIVTEATFPRGTLDPWVLSRAEIAKKVNVKKFKRLHVAVRERAEERLKAARKSFKDGGLEERRAKLRHALKGVLGDSAPPATIMAKVVRSKDVPSGTTEWIDLEAGDGTPLPAVLVRPKVEGKVPVVVAVCQHGKGRFLFERALAISKLLERKIAILLVDVRGTGETAPDYRHNPESAENLEAMRILAAGEVLLGLRLKDFRTALAYAASRKDLDGERMGVWGESFSKLNPPRLRVDELPFRAASPQIQYQAEPLGALLALLGALYEPRVKAVYTDGGLVSYRSVLDDAFYYLPTHCFVPGFLSVADVPDVRELLAPKAACYVNSVDGRNRALPENAKEEFWKPILKAYNNAKKESALVLDPVNPRPDTFFGSALRPAK